jgi:hypothetical protein
MPGKVYEEYVDIIYICERSLCCLILRLWYSGLRYRVVLLVDADASEEYAASNFRVQVCRFTNRHADTGNLKGRWS